MVYSAIQKGQKMVREEVLIYKILEWVEEYVEECSFSPSEIPNFHPEVVNEHVRLCMEAGLIEASPRFRKGLPQIVGWRIHRLTWQGHEKLAALRRSEKSASRG